ncbi:2-keto-3-deoxy-L-rhamnonate aldolase RhmA [Rhizobium leguminosarum]|uniref:2-keto-3-deoxy-L-rhamnonate aldolase RhmA n=1 Tax=Rhizobium leguminosarum TaxID=384 RepID=A0AAE2MPJ8_RHILE|nr:2-keto-3-deoxy-L-rhamnonate aldolase RhmA [Rhizobium leguminosarum]MBB4435332.1 2-keto-3-deoxy-L-rhamnonate aldolase RhmA [Rhizobium esperanzae]MBB4299979.1 2-keto-3-deoxy-L-rhamnonate aldolase RhmA [Rhizobium leguminosarum]MBB4311105.1 2-keto-3-deoxy-L-rhamnonate aldolase RhmA [Rhizobium leguminosarum]MBB4532264.1 2-keto-3-deoxy-L-rhamnonate aldolase RhmA [Rhizobium leguminosarum]
MVDTAEQARAIVDAVRYALPSDFDKRLVVAMIETVDAIDNLDEMLKVDGIDVFFIGPGDLSQNMGYPPAPPFGEPRPEAVMEKVAVAVDKIRAAGKITGTLATADELPHWWAFHHSFSIPVIQCLDTKHTAWGSSPTRTEAAEFLRHRPF